MLLIAVTDKNRKGAFSLTMVYRQKNTREGLPIFWGGLRCLSPFRTHNPLCEATTPGAVDYGGCDYGECDYGGCYGLLVRVWVRVRT